MYNLYIQPFTGDGVLEYLVDNIDVGQRRVRVLAGQRQIGQMGRRSMSASSGFQY